MSKSYGGEKADVTWDERLCIHFGECVRAQNALFVGGRDPWCAPDEVEAETVVDVIERCPTGALSYARKDGGPAETAPARNTVQVAGYGPLHLRGELKIDGATDDMPGVRFRAALCRCGASQNKPFCDGAHEQAAFRDQGAVGELGGSLEAEGGELTVKRAKNGPLLLSGNFTILAGSGRAAWKGQKTALCRCGHSGNKPFCDGSHNSAGFEAE